MSTTAFHSRARGSSDVYDPTRVCCSICLRILRYTAAMLPFGAPCHAVMAYSHYYHIFVVPDCPVNTVYQGQLRAHCAVQSSRVICIQSCC